MTAGETLIEQAIERAKREGYPAAVAFLRVTLVRTAVRICGGNQTKAAELLNTNRNNIVRNLANH